nr:MAG TPA: hypothetical protein [Caudoviricetes sp.]
MIKLRIIKMNISHRCRYITMSQKFFEICKLRTCFYGFSSKAMSE